MSKKDEKIDFQTNIGEAIFKIIIIGDPAVGKTSLLSKYSTDLFETQYIATIGVNILKKRITLNIKNKEISVALLLWDMSGQPQFYMLHKPYFNGADGMMLVFDITRSSTFSNIKNWYNTAVKYGLKNIPGILIGNKIDLKDQRKIIRPMAEHLSKELDAPYFETSAKTGVNVDLIFEKISKSVYNSKITV